MKRLTTASLLVLSGVLLGCQPEVIERSTAADETFYVQNAGAALRVTVKGNTASNFTSAFSNLIATGRSGLAAELLTAQFSTELGRVTIPVLVCAGQYDFV